MENNKTHYDPEKDRNIREYVKYDKAVMEAVAILEPIYAKELIKEIQEVDKNLEEDKIKDSARHLIQRGVLEFDNNYKLTVASAKLTEMLFKKVENNHGNDV